MWLCRPAIGYMHRPGLAMGMCIGVNHHTMMLSEVSDILSLHSIIPSRPSAPIKVPFAISTGKLTHSSIPPHWS